VASLALVLVSSGLDTVGAFGYTAGADWALEQRTRGSWQIQKDLGFSGSQGLTSLLSFGIIALQSENLNRYIYDQQIVI
jgi:hypothetical protein